MSDAMTRHLARQRLAEARGAVSQLRREMVEQIRKARNHSDPDLTADDPQTGAPGGLTRKREEMVTAIRAHYAPRVAQLEAQVRTDAEMLRTHAAKQIPTLPN